MKTRLTVKQIVNYLSKPVDYGIAPSPGPSKRRQ